ncbi:hypothetical protein SAMN02745866_04232 [Alteromonadaceae bacterium Bs31]|nr:hypothetical protein SAMN02745866_04232 [Alteromonadaceae bacterium Bs31]
MSTRPAAVAGTFYPEDPNELSLQIEALLAQNKRALAEPCAPKALIVPHAGYLYSGPTAAIAYNTLLKFKHKISRVVILGLSHRVPFRGIAASSASYFTTPLGAVAVDTKSIKGLKEKALVTELDSAHSSEHSLEVQLPFLQKILAQFTLVPLVTGQCDVREVALCLEEFWNDEQTLLLVSSDLSHFHDYREACSIDKKTCQLVQQQYFHLNGDQACGSYGVNGLLYLLASKKARIEILDYRNSGDTAGDKQRVVGYGAFAVYYSQ